MSLYLSLKPTTNCRPFSRIKWEIYFYKEVFRSFIEFRKSCLIEYTTKWLMFNWILSDTQQCLEPFNFVDFCQIEFLEIEVFDYLIVYIYQMCLQIRYLIYKTQDLALNNPRRLICHESNLKTIRKMATKNILGILKFLLKYWKYEFLEWKWNEHLESSSHTLDGRLHGLGANLLSCDIVVCEFELQSRYYIHFRTNAHWKKYEPPYPPPPCYGIIIPLLLFYENVFHIK